MKKQFIHLSILFMLLVSVLLSLCVYANTNDDPKMDIVELQEEIVRFDDAYLATYTRTESESLSIKQKLQYPKLARTIYASWMQLAQFSPDAYFPQYDWRWNQTYHEQNIDRLLEDTSITALVVSVYDTREAIQYVSTDEEYGMTFTPVQIKNVLRNSDNDPNLIEGNTIYLKESFFVSTKDNSDPVLMCDYGAQQQPLGAEGNNYLIFLRNLYDYKTSDPFPQNAYTFYERYYWDCMYDGSKAYRNSINGLLEYGLYADYREIQYEYHYKVMSHFNLHEEETPPSAANPSAEGPNWLAVFASIVVLGGIGALAYTVNETVKKNKSKDFK